jgi:hypothetical protein
MVVLKRDGKDRTGIRELWGVTGFEGRGGEGEICGDVKWGRGEVCGGAVIGGLQICGDFKKKNTFFVFFFFFFFLIFFFLNYSFMAKDSVVNGDFWSMTWVGRNSKKKNLV